MELHIALKELVEAYGENILSHPRLIRKLMDKRAFSEIPATKGIMIFAKDLGYIDRIYNNCMEDDWYTQNQSLVREFVKKCSGVNEDDVSYVFNCIPYSLELLEFEDDDSDANEELEFNYEQDEDESFEEMQDLGEGLDEEETNNLIDPLKEDEEYIETNDYTITKHYHENKGVDIYVVRLTNRVDSDTFANYKEIARKHGKGYYSTFHGVNGFVFYSMDDAKQFADNIFNNELNDSDGEKETSSPQHNPGQLSDSDIIKSNSPENNKHQYDINNMELHLALRNIIDTDGIGIVNDVRIINILSDLKAFNTTPALKYILRAVIADGYANRLMSCGKWDTNAMALCNHFASSTGFQEEYVMFVFQSIAYGLRFLNNIVIPNPTKHQIQQNTSSTTPSKDPSLFCLGYKELRRKSEKFLSSFKENVEEYLDGIIEKKGDWSLFGAKITPTSEYTIYDNDSKLEFHFEINGKIACKQKSGFIGLHFYVVLYNYKGKMLSKSIAYLNKDNLKLPYQIVTSSSLMEQAFKTVGNISKIIVYWEEV